MFSELDELLGEKKVSDDKYFKSYENIYTHKRMIQDRPRTLAYQRSLEANKAKLKDKVVIDVGAGTGILSIFAARAGARHVYAIEYSDTAHMARKIIAENGLTDKITVI